MAAPESQRAASSFDSTGNQIPPQAVTCQRAIRQDGRGGKSGGEDPLKYTSCQTKVRQSIETVSDSASPFGVNGAAAAAKLLTTPGEHCDEWARDSGDATHAVCVMVVIAANREPPAAVIATVAAPQAATARNSSNQRAIIAAPVERFVRAILARK